MSYSMMGFGDTTSCAGSATAGADYNRAAADSKTKCERASTLRRRINTLREIVKDQTPLIGSGEITAEKVELFQAERELPGANADCDRAIEEKNRLLKRFIAFQAAGCYAPSEAPPVRTGETTVEHIRGEKAPTVVELPEVTITGEKPPAKKYAGPGYSAGSCPSAPARTREGQKGQAVFCWQRFLKSKGFSLTADGDHGPITEEASKKFESATAAAPTETTPAQPATPAKPATPAVSTASMLPKQILGMPTTYALAGFAVLLAGGAYYYLSNPENQS